MSGEWGVGSWELEVGSWKWGVGSLYKIVQALFLYYHHKIYLYFIFLHLSSNKKWNYEKNIVGAITSSINY